MRRTGLWGAVLAVAVLTTPAAGYYHYTHYLARTAPYSAIPEKFDVNALPNKTVTVYVSDSGPVTYAANDSFASVLSQIRQAALTWNSVDTSDLRVAFGGLMQTSTSPVTPGIQVIFGEMAPGVRAQTFQSVSSSIGANSTGQFYAIQRPTVMFKRDMSVIPGPSYLDIFYTTTVHELGHALGLQHTFTSSVMTTAAGGRTTNRVRPLDADDIAGLSALYPKTGYLASTGTITGRVTSGGVAVPMVSVVALRPLGGAVSAITDPDGRYTIAGLAPDSYYVYVSPLPTDADITLPQDTSGRTFAAFSGVIESKFYPGTREIAAASQLTVARGATIGNIDFSVQKVSAAAAYDGSTFNVISQTYVAPAYLSTANTARVAFAFDALPATKLPQSAQLLGLDHSMTFQLYSDAGATQTLGLAGTQFLSLSLQVPSGASSGPRHLILNFGSDMYVLPSAVFITQKQPPQVQSAISNADGSVSIAGTNLGVDSTVLFDGLPAPIRTLFTGTDAFGTIVVTPPTGFSGQSSTITVYNSDTQSTQLLQSSSLPVYQYAAADTPLVTVSPSSLPANTSSLIDIVGTNTKFVEGQVTVGFGTPDIVVRRVWVVSPTHLVANVAVQSNATVGLSGISVISGFQRISQPYSFMVQAVNSRAVTVWLPLLNGDATYTTYFRGTTLQVYGNNLAASGTPTVTLTDLNGTVYSAQTTFASGYQVNFVIPAGIPTGLATLRIFNGSETSYPVGIQIDAQAPSILTVTSSTAGTVDTTRSAAPGDILTMVVSGLDTTVTSSRLRVHASGIELPIQSVTSLGTVTQVQAVVRQSFGGGQVALTVTQDTTPSAAYSLLIR